MGKNNIHVSHVGIMLCVLILLTCETGQGPQYPYLYGPLAIEDSLAVRAILDSNGLKTIPVRKVLDSFAQGRITFLYLNSLNLKTFNFTQNFNVLDSLISLSLDNNQISSITVTDSIKFVNSCTISLTYNSLTTFPIDIFKIIGAPNIFLENNVITSLPEELIHSGPPNYDIDHNKLCSLTDSAVIKWLDTTYGNWRLRQDCP